MYRNNQEDALAVRSSGFVSAKCVMGRGIESRRLGYFKKKRRLINTPETLSINAFTINSNWERRRFIHIPETFFDL
jgi:hypothetical protein